MRNFNSWVKRLSLSQQLFMLIFAFITFFAFFFFIYISDTVADYTNNQMLAVLKSYESNMSTLYELYAEQGIAVISSDTSDNPDYLTYYFTVEDGEIKKVYGRDDEAIKDAVGNRMRKEIEAKVILYAELDSQTLIREQEFNTYSNKSGAYAYYSIKKLKDGTIMVNMLNNVYPKQFRDDLLNSVIDITVFVVGIFFIILMLWVAYLIHPLNQIRAYIEKIKMGKEPVLKVNREDEIGELAHALITMREELKRQEKTKEEMIHNISHDLKTPIATIKSYAESIKDGVYPYDTLEKSVDVIIENAERLEKKVHSLLFMNRIEYLASQEQDEVMCDMKEVVETVVLNTKLIRPEIEVETNLISSYFRGGDEAWRGAVENILENALRYAQTQIVITLDEKQLCIYNDGPQFKENQMDTMFKPFEKGQGGKFGLGLSIVQKVVSANKYRVVAENVETGGVIFKIMK
ncbi:MAG: HAMP domain-containing histidine kinase [Erysipelotrichia bacterium]|nr:HAMP domain-containing histidine kinase [Erysipelotrichia bacterium]NCC53930.1 HAMP domain-containing histidine kinase [Erysipelotrichia bacterium]